MLHITKLVHTLEWADNQPDLFYPYPNIIERLYQATQRGSVHGLLLHWYNAHSMEWRAIDVARTAFELEEKYE
jgi:hypothetical protein